MCFIHNYFTFFHTVYTGEGNKETEEGEKKKNLFRCPVMYKTATGDITHTHTHTVMARCVVLLLSLTACRESMVLT